jgi:hypothetical protein
VTEALGDPWKALHELAAKAKPEQILFRRYASFYPTERVQADLTSGGMPLLPETFNVLLGLNGPVQRDEPQFRIEKAAQNVVEMPREALP